MRPAVEDVRRPGDDGARVGPGVVRALEQSMEDVGARAAWIVDRGEGIEVLAPRIERRGIEQVMAWLPPVARRKARRAGLNRSA